jgi:hypothetical protein
MDAGFDRLRPDDVDRLFADWGAPVIVRRVDQALDSDFDDVSESETNFEVQAVLWPARSRSTNRTGMQHLSAVQEFLIRAIDLPEDLPLSSCRIATPGREWSVIQVTRSADGRVVQLRGQAT